MKDKKNAIPAVPTHNSQNAKRSAEAQHEIPIATGSRAERDVPAQGQKGHAKDAGFQASESVQKQMVGTELSTADWNRQIIRLRRARDPSLPIVRKPRRRHKVRTGRALVLIIRRHPRAAVAR